MYRERNILTTIGVILAERKERNGTDSLFLIDFMARTIPDDVASAILVRTLFVRFSSAPWTPGTNSSKGVHAETNEFLCVETLGASV